jgi:hypothetical protein
MAHDVFVSHSVKDKAVADAVVARLEAESVTCWIAPRDVVPGADWGESIIDAIESSRIMILIFSQSANASSQIKREVERAVNKEVYIIPFRVDDIPPTRALEYFISSSQWMDAFSPPLERHLDDLAKTVKAVLESSHLPRADASVEPESKTPMATPQISHASVSDVVPPAAPRPFDSKRSVVKLILLAIAWMVVFWVSSLFLAGALAGILNPRHAEDLGRKVGESFSGLFFLIALGLSIWLTVAGKLPGTKKTLVARKGPMADGSTVHLSSRSRRAIIVTVPVLIILGAAAWYLGHKREGPPENASAPTTAEKQAAVAKPAEYEIRHENTPNVPSGASSNSGSRTNQEPATAKVFVKARNGPFGVWIDPQKWTQESSEENPIKITFNHKTGDAYAMVISERIGLTTDTLKNAAVANAKKVMPDVTVASEEKRVVNGKEALCLKLTGTIQGIPFIYYGYYYGGSEGTLQVVTYTASNIFDDFKQDFDDFLNGTQIGQEPATSKVFVKARKGRFGVWIDPQKWEQDSSEEDPIKITFNHKKGEAYAMVISERAGMPIETLKKIAVANAKKAAPDAKIASEEKRVVKGKELLCLKLTGTIQGIPCTYYGYYYGGSEGTLQVLTYTASNIFDEFKQDFDDFLDGIQIGK